MEIVRRLLAENPMEIVWPVLTFAATFLLGWLVRWITLRALVAWTSRSQSKGGEILIEALRGHALIWTVILGLQLAFQSSNLPLTFRNSGGQILFICWAISITLMCTRIGGNLVRVYGAHVPGALPVTTLSQNLVQIVLIILGAAAILDHFQISVTPILTALGVGGIAVALALQDTLSNLFAGFYVAVARQVRTGDYIKLNSGEEGYVADITWRTTSIRTLANNLTLVPNAKLAQANVTNYYLPEKRMAASLQVGVSYTHDPDVIERILGEVVREGAKDIPGMLAEPAPSVSFDPGFGEWSLGFTVNFQISEFVQQYSVRNELRKRIARRFRAEGIEIPFPTRTVHVEGNGKPPA